jgi:molybdopterin synthase sulfur carrier subunit
MQVLYFAWVREAVGTAAEEVSPPAEVGNVAELIDWLEGHSERHADAFKDRARLRAAVDQAFVPLSAPIRGAKEIAIFPPVTGG